MKSIRTRVMITGFLAILFISNTLAGITYSSYKKLMLNEIYLTLEHNAKDSSDYIGTLLESQRIPLERMANAEAMRSMQWPKQKKYLLEQPFDYYIAPFVADIDGYANYVTGERIYIGDRDYFKTALSGTLNYSDVLTSRITNEPVIIMATPILDENQVIHGVLCVRLDLSKISNGINTSRWGDEGSAFILNAEGTIISHENMAIDDAQLKLQQLIEQDIKWRPLQLFVDNVKTQTHGTGSFIIDHSEKIVGYSDIKGTNWKLFVGAESSYVMRGIITVQVAFCIMTVVLNLIAFIFAYRLTKVMTQPIIDLDAAFQAASQGDLSVRLQNHSNDEYGRASMNFNKMMNVLKTLTYADPITQLPNLNVLHNATKTHQKGPMHFTLLIIAVEHFSRFNEQYGYNRGDQALSQIADIIQDEMAQKATVYRGKGDEFILHFHQHVHPHLIEQYAQSLLKRLSLPLIIEDKPIYLRYSMGYDTLYTSTLNIDEILSNATHAKNISKSKGGNLITAYNKSNHMALLKQHSLEEDLIAAIEEKSFHMVYQPLYDLKTNQLVDIEALIRWFHPTHGFVSPEYFIDLAEKLGHIVALDHWVIDAVFKQQALWHERQVISINISAHTFESDDFVAYIQAKIKHYALEPHQIQLELTERVLIKNIQSTIEKLNALRALGLKIALDDFGIGYSSLSYLVQLPLDSLKIDKSFICEITKDPQTRMIVKTIIDMGHNLGLTTIAEGIENEETITLLKTLGCQIGQGYFFSKPVPPDQLYT